MKTEPKGNKLFWSIRPGPHPVEIRLAKLSVNARALAVSRKAFDLPDEFLGPSRSEILKAKRYARSKDWESMPDVKLRRIAKQSERRRSEQGRKSLRDAARKRRARYSAEQIQRRRETWRRSNANPRTKLNHRLRVRLSKFYRGRNIGGCEALTGLTRQGLLDYLQSKLKPGMTLENYGTAWHIDHTIPCRAFDLSRIDEVKRCFHFSNLTPMWATENMSKGGKIIKRQPELPFAFHE